jgi:hypothetical protein
MHLAIQDDILQVKACSNYIHTDIPPREFLIKWFRGSGPYEDVCITRIGKAVALAEYSAWDLAHGHGPDAELLCVPGNSATHWKLRCLIEYIFSGIHRIAPDKTLLGVDKNPFLEMLELKFTVKRYRRLYDAAKRCLQSGAFVAEWKGRLQENPPSEEQRVSVDGGHAIQRSGAPIIAGADSQDGVRGGVTTPKGGPVGDIEKEGGFGKYKGKLRGWIDKKFGDPNVGENKPQRALRAGYIDNELEYYGLAPDQKAELFGMPRSSYYRYLKKNTAG